MRENRLVAVFGHAARAAGEGQLVEIAARLQQEQVGILGKAVERRLRGELPVAPQHLPAIFAACDRFGGVGAGFVAAAVVGGGIDVIGDRGLVIEAVVLIVQPDQLEPPGAEREFIIAADLVVIAAVVRIVGPQIIDPDHRVAGLVARQVEIEPVIGGVEIADRSSRPVPLERAGDFGILVIDGQHHVARFEQRVVAVADSVGPAHRAAPVIVRNGERVIDLARGPTERNFAAVEIVVREMRPAPRRAIRSAR